MHGDCAICDITAAVQLYFNSYAEYWIKTINNQHVTSIINKCDSIDCILEKRCVKIFVEFIQ